MVMRRVSPGGSRLARWRVAALAPVAFALLAVSCSSSSNNTAGGGGFPTENVFVQKFRYHGLPSNFSSGNVVINFSNRESLPITHEMILLALPQGQNAQSVINDAKSKGPDAEGDYTSMGEIGEVDTGSTKSQIFDLPAGKYAIACFEQGNLGDPEAKGKTHAARGMVFQFSVS
jgi:hypothetical protein